MKHKNDFASAHAKLHKSQKLVHAALESKLVSVVPEMQQNADQSSKSESQCRT